MNKKIFRIALFVLCMCTFLCVSSQVSVQAQQSPTINTLQTIEDDESLDEDLDNENPDDQESTIAQQIELDLISGGTPLDNTSDITDKNLYSVLMQRVKSYIRETYDGYIYSGSTLYTTMLKNVETLIIEDMDITDLNGIEKIRFDSLKNLTIANNKITSIPDNFFDRMGKLEYLNLACNKITEITFPRNSTLRKINLSSNNLTKANFSQLTQINLDINVANNKFTSISDIGLSTRIESVNLNIINNNILDLTDDYFTSDKIKLNIGLQGVNGEDVSVDTSTNLRFYKTNLTNVYVKIYKVGRISDEYTGVTISDSDVSENFYNISLDVGEYYAEYYGDYGMLYSKGDSEKDYFYSYHFKVIPTTCTVKYEFKGKMYDTFENKVTGKVKVYLSCEEGGTIYYKLSGDEWIEGNEILCDKGGNYSIQTKVVKGDYESEIKSIFIKTSLNLIIPDIVMLILLLLFTLTLFLIVVPYVSKKWFRN